MKKYFILIFLIACSHASSSPTLTNPLLKPEMVIDGSNNYLVKEKAIALEKYELTSISFNYYSQYGNTSNT